MLQVPFVEQVPYRVASESLRSLADVAIDDKVVVVDGEFFGPAPLPAPLQPQHDAIVARDGARNWMDRLGEFTVLTKNSAVLVRGHVAPSDARVLFRGRTPLPPVHGGQGILLFLDGTYERLTD
jgi:hypothetical protein